MLSKSRLGIEDKATRPGETKGPGSVRCSKCGHTSYHCSSAVIPACCPDCRQPAKITTDRDPR